MLTLSTTAALLLAHQLNVLADAGLLEDTPCQDLKAPDAAHAKADGVGTTT